MHIYEKKSVFARVLGFLCSILPAIFWLLVILGFEEPASAVITLICAFIHEAGHICFIYLRSGDEIVLRGVLDGLRISGRKTASYTDTVLTYLCGPLANLLAFLLSLFFIKYGEYPTVFSIMNLATAISNLLPIVGYDGYGALKTIFEYTGREELICSLEKVSLGLTVAMLLISLHLIDRYDAGYWIFGLFFFSVIDQIKKSIQKQNWSI